MVAPESMDRMRGVSGIDAPDGADRAKWEIMRDDLPNVRGGAVVGVICERRRLRAEM
jgi:hypothetical protein